MTAFFVQLHNTDICLPMRLYPSASVFVSASSQKFFHSGTAALLQKSSVNLWSCRSKTAAFKSTEHSPLRLSNAFTRKSPIYKACAHLQTHTSPPYYIWHWTMRGRTVVRISSSPNPLNPICEYGYRGEGCFLPCFMSYIEWDTWASDLTFFLMRILMFWKNSVSCDWSHGAFR